MLRQATSITAKSQTHEKMEEAIFQIENLFSKTTTKLTKDIGCTSLTLDVTVKNSCNNCRSRGFSSCNCGYNQGYHQGYNNHSNNNKNDLEIKATIKTKFNPGCNLKMDLEKALFLKI